MPAVKIGSRLLIEHQAPQDTRSTVIATEKPSRTGGLVLLPVRPVIRRLPFVRTLSRALGRLAVARILQIGLDLCSRSDAELRPAATAGPHARNVGDGRHTPSP